ncbi:MAG: TonB-dependent receptor, partial [Acidobacteriota bacterium]
MNSLLPKLSRIFAVSLCLVIIVFVQSSVAQETRGTIRGTVLDPNKQPVFNATVTVIDPSRGTKISLTTNGEGFYQATYLIPGIYQVVVEANGFKKALRENVLLQIAGAVQVDIPLEIGGAQETVTVTTDIPQLNTENASLGQVVDSQRLAELPLVHGDPYTLIGTSNGTSFTGDPRLDRPFEPTHIVGYAINGSRGNRMDLTIDGVASTATADAGQIIASYVPPSDIIQEFKVQTATFDAQFGNTEGSVTSIMIKSGTNNFHGTGYTFLEPGQWAANDSFGKARGNPRPNTYSDRFGGYVSGPIHFPKLYDGKDKSFFLFGFEDIKDARPRFDLNTPAWVPTAALAAGDFSAFLCPTGVTTGCTNIYDPLTRPSGSGSAAQFSDPSRGTPGNPTGLNIIPLSRIDSVAKAFMTYMGQPKNPGLVGNINDSTLLEKTKLYYNWTFRVDQQISQNNHVFVRGSWYYRNGLYNRYTDSPYDGQAFAFKSRGGVIDDVHTFNSTTFLNVKYGYNRFVRVSQSQDDALGFDLTNLWGPTQGATYNNIVGDSIRRFPSLLFPTSGTGGTLRSGIPTNEIRPNDSQNAAAVLSKTWGRHSFKFGGELRIYREDDVFQNSSQTGAFTFDNTYTRQSTSSSAGPQEFNGLQAFASFLLGLPSGQAITRASDYSEYSKTWGFFVQDDFKLGRNLTINAGLRYEKEQPLAERQDKTVTGFDFSFVQPSQTQVNTNLTAADTDLSGNRITSLNVPGGLLFAGKDSKKTYLTPNNTFLPRFGVAYRLGDHTVIRGGIGLFAGFLGQRRSDVLQPGYTRTTSLGTTTNSNGATIPVNWDTFPSLISILEPVGNAAGKQTGLGGSVTFFNLHPKSPKQLRWQVGIQREMKWGFVGEATYVGDYGYDLEIVKDLNALPVGDLIASDAVDCSQGTNSTTVPLCIRNSALTATIPNPFRNVPGYEGTTLFTSSTVQRQVLLRPFPQFCTNSTCGVITTNNDGKSWYNAAQFGLTKRFSSGNTIQLAYTWSKWLQATEYLNAGDLKPTRMISDYDSPHTFSTTGIYKIPLGKGQKWVNDNSVLDAIVGGWQLQGVYR